MAVSTISVVTPASTEQFVVLQNPAPGSGGRPELPRQMTEVLARGGVDGVSVRLMGIKGPPFQMVGGRDALDLANAEARITAWNALCGKVVTLVQGGVDFQAAYSIRFCVLDVHDVRKVRITRGVGGLVANPQFWITGVFDMVAFIP